MLFLVIAALLPSQSPIESAAPRHSLGQGAASRGSLIERARRAAPGDHAAVVLAARRLEAVSPVRAIDALTAHLSQHPSDRLARLELAGMLARRGRATEGIRDAMEVVRRQPRSAAAELDDRALAAIALAAFLHAELAESRAREYPFHAGRAGELVTIALARPERWSESEEQTLRRLAGRYGGGP